jgi:hypothetical protein
LNFGRALGRLSFHQLLRVWRCYSKALSIDRADSRPDFAVLGYPVISLIEAWTHQESKNNLLGANPDPELAKSLSGELSVTRQTPPTFLFQTNADTTVPAENSLYYYLDCLGACS